MGEIGNFLVTAAGSCKLSDHRVMLSLHSDFQFEFSVHYMAIITDSPLQTQHIA